MGSHLMTIRMCGSRPDSAKLNFQVSLPWRQQPIGQIRCIPDLNQVGCTIRISLLKPY